MICEKTKLSKIGITIIFLALAILIIPGCASKKMTVNDSSQNVVANPDATKLITQISATEDERAATITILANKELAYSAVKQPFPLSVILIFPGTALNAGMAPYLEDNSDVISSIKFEELTGHIQTTKVIISLKKDVAYEVKPEGSVVKVVLEKSAADSSVKEYGQITDSNMVATSPESSVESQPTVQAQPLKKNDITNSSAAKQQNKEQDIGYGKPCRVNRIDFSSEDAGKSTIIIGTTKPVKYKITKASNNRIQLKLINSRIASYRQRPLITTRFESAVNRIIPMQSPDRPNTTLVSIELREAVPYFVEQTDNILQIHFEASSIPPQPFDQANLPPWKKILEKTVSADQEDQMETDETKDEEPDDFRQAGVGKKYTGEKIALDFYDTDIKNVLRILKEVSGMNFAIDKDVSGKVTMAFDKPVPWDQVLYLVLKMNKLGKIHEDDVIRIATLKTLKDEEKSRKEKLKAKQEAELQEDFVTAFLPVNYATAEDLVKLIFIERGTITVDAPSNTIIMKAPPIEIERARTIVNTIDKVTPQVIIEARVVEVTKDFTRSLGTAWNASGGPVDHNALGKLGGLVAGSNVDTSTGLNLFPNSTPTGLIYNVAMNHAVVGTSGIGFDFSRLTGSSLLLNAQLTALQTEGNAKIISSPKILTRDNEMAKIKQGLEYPYLERDDSGGASVKFKDIDLLLEVTPHITPDQRIAMTVKITKNDLAGFFGDVPTVTTNEVETAVLVDNGDTIVIGGIVQSSTNLSSTGTPWLSKIPILGWMFKSKTNTSQDNELLVFITPKILQL